CALPGRGSGCGGAAGHVRGTPPEADEPRRLHRPRRELAQRDLVVLGPGIGIAEPLGKELDHLRSVAEGVTRGGPPPPAPPRPGAAHPTSGTPRSPAFAAASSTRENSPASRASR